MNKKQITCWLFTASLILIPIIVNAQPDDRILWTLRARSYANTFWSNYNPEYGDNRDQGGDCANFVTQIAQAGCGGMCETNANDPNEENGWGWALNNCNNFWDQDGNMEDHCYRYDDSEHETFGNVWHMLGWIWATCQQHHAGQWLTHVSCLGYEVQNNNGNWELVAVDQLGPEDEIDWQGDFANTISYGCIAIMAKARNEQGPYAGHVMWISGGSAASSTYSQHSPSARNASFPLWIREYQRLNYYQRYSVHGGGFNSQVVKGIQNEEINNQIRNSRIK